MELFRGYVLTRNKQCMEKFKGVKRLKTLDDVPEKLKAAVQALVEGDTD